MRPAVRRGGIALSAITFLMWTGASASASDASSVAEDVVAAIDAVAGGSLDRATGVVSADSTVAAGGGVSVDLSSDAADGVSINSSSGGDLGIGLPFAETADGATVVDGVMVYDNRNGSSTTPLVNKDGSVQILTTLVDRDAPTRYEYTFEVDRGGSLVLTEDGGVDVMNADGLAVSHVAAPWALDANGHAVATWYEVDGNTLAQVVDHGASTAYPVVADPKISFGWRIYLKYNKSEVKSQVSGWRGTVNDKQKYASVFCAALVSGGRFGQSRQLRVPCTSMTRWPQS